MRIGILGLLHESNTFIRQPTTLQNFAEDLWLEGPAIVERLAGSHHELGGFLAGLKRAGERCDVETVPLLVARAMPAGPIEAATMEQLVERMLAAIDRHRGLDGLLVAAHGAAVSQSHPDADGYWLGQVRKAIGADVPLVATLDPHANLSPAMVAACDALIAYRTNPHLDQWERGLEACELLIRLLEDQLRPHMAAAYLPLVINIERQGTDEPHLRPIYDLAEAQRASPRVLSNSILLGFPYADVAEMGSAVLAITDGDAALARQLTNQLADRLWEQRWALEGILLSVEQALERCEVAAADQTIGLLDMGDNVGGGSAADGTLIAHALCQRELGPAFVCLLDPLAVQRCVAAGVGAELELAMGGRTDSIHGPPLKMNVRVRSLHSGQFQETLPRHGGISQFDQGPTAVVTASKHPLTVMLTSKRMVPFSLQQLLAFGIEPRQYRLLIIKGVHAPLAAYRSACDLFLQVNTPGATCADLTQLAFRHRRHPLFPLDRDCRFAPPVDG